MGAIILSYGDSTENENNVPSEKSAWRYIEGFLAYQGWRDQDSQSYRLWQEAMSQKEQMIPEAPKNVMGGAPFPMRHEILPDKAELPRYPKPEMVSIISNSDEEYPQGKSFFMAFHHPHPYMDEHAVIQYEKQFNPYIYKLDRDEVEDDFGSN